MKRDEFTAYLLLLGFEQVGQHKWERRNIKHISALRIVFIKHKVHVIVHRQWWYVQKTGTASNTSRQFRQHEDAVDYLRTLYEE